jgi:SPOR domain
MAESNTRKIADPFDLDEGDPFAELTRIMGFDPRKLTSPQPKELVGANNARPSVIAAVVPDAATSQEPALPTAHDDFGIDLEKELLGGFDDFDQPAQPSLQAAETLVSPAAAATPVRAPVAAALVPAPVAAAPATGAADLAADETDLIDSIDWEPMEAELAAVAQASARDHDFEEASAAHAVIAPAVEGPASIADTPLDDDLAAELDREFSDVQPAMAAPVTEVPVGRTAAWSTPMAEQPAAVADDLPEDDLEAELDRQFLELQPATEAPVTDVPVGRTAAWSAPAAEQQAGVDDDLLDDDFEAELDRQFAELQPVAAVPVTDVPAAQAEAWFAPAVEQSAPAADDLPNDDFEAELDQHFEEPVPATPVMDVPARTAAWSASPSSVADPGAAELDAHVAPASEDELVPDFDLADLGLHEDEVEDHHDEAQIAAPDQVAEDDVAADLTAAIEAPAPEEVAKKEVFADVDMDFDAALERELDRQNDQRPLQMVAAEPALARPEIGALAPPQSPAPADAAAAMDHQFEISLEDEISALLESEDAQPEMQDVRPAAQVAAPRAAAAADASRGHFLSDPRWAALEAVGEEGSVYNSSRSASHAVPAGRVDQAAATDRRPFGDTSLTGRHANFQVPQQQAAQPAEDLDDLLHTMEHETHSPEQAPAPMMAVQPAAPDTRLPASEEQARFADHAEDTAAETGYDSVPDIETVDVPEAAVAIADDLDLPELVYEEDERQQPAAYDDIEADFAATFNPIAASEEPVSQTARGAARPTERASSDVDFSPLYRTTSPQAATAAPAEEIEFEPLGDEEQDTKSVRYEDEDAAATTDHRFVDLDFGSDVEEGAAVAVAAYQQAERPRRGGARAIAALVAGVALLGGAGAFALSQYGGKSSDVPVLVKADSGPVKVKPENPGGSAVPAQDNRVYDAVKGKAAAETAKPMQPRLVTTQEEPLDVAVVDKAQAATEGAEAATDRAATATDMAAAATSKAAGATGKVDALPGVGPDALPKVAIADSAPVAEGAEARADAGTADTLPGVEPEKIVPKAEDRVDPVADADQDAPVDDAVSVAPRRVKTMVVRSDGTLVPRDEPAAAAKAGTPVAPAAVDQPQPQANDDTGAVDNGGASAQAPADGDPVPVKTVKSTKVNGDGKATGDTVAPKAVRSTKVDAVGKPEGSQPAATEDATQQAAADPAPQPAPAKAAQPAQPKPSALEEIAAANVEPAAIANGSWSVQIASQPSADAAKSTYQDLAQRYGSVIGGRGVNIVKADVEGKGTYWRVRVPAKSRNDAISLCSDYKAAGGNCFVSK